mgnify:CR=1 FL=1
MYDNAIQPYMEKKIHTTTALKNLEIDFLNYLIRVFH